MILNTEFFVLLFRFSLLAKYKNLKAPPMPSQSKVKNREIRLVGKKPERQTSCQQIVNNSTGKLIFFIVISEEFFKSACKSESILKICFRSCIGSFALDIKSIAWKHKSLISSGKVILFCCSNSSSCISV